MRLLPKYKNYLKLITKNYPIRILKFKKSKWVRYKTLILKLKPKFIFYKLLNININTKNWERINQNFKNSLLLKTNFIEKFGQAININKTFKKYNTLNELFCNLFIKNNYRLDIIIWQLNLSCSVFESRDLIKRGLVFVNQKPTKIFNLFLKKGDIITLKNDIQNKIYKQKKDIILTFLEIDFYLNTFIITKDLNELSSQDITCLMQEKYSSYLLKNIIN
jgi:hypothetical protein